jgi:hypothetical protein
MRTRDSLSTLFVVLIMAGCRGTRTPDIGMKDSTFVATLADLRRAETDTSLDPTMKDSTRRMILRRHRVTSKQLEAAAKKLAAYPARASDLWRQIESPPHVVPPPRPPDKTTVRP